MIMTCKCKVKISTVPFTKNMLLDLISFGFDLQGSFNFLYLICFACRWSTFPLEFKIHWHGKELSRHGFFHDLSKKRWTWWSGKKKYNHIFIFDDFLWKVLMTITIDQEKNKKVLFVCEYNRGTQEVTTISWSSTLHSNCEKCEIVKLKFSWFWSFPLQVTYLKNFSLFVEPKVETLGIQEHVSLGKTLVSNWFWWNAWNINISKKITIQVGKWCA